MQVQLLVGEKYSAEFSHVEYSDHFFYLQIPSQAEVNAV